MSNFIWGIILFAILWQFGIIQIILTVLGTALIFAGGAVLSLAGSV
jgi:hypothetical protein